MAMLNKLRLRFRALFLKSKMEEELDEEVRFHLEREIEENIVRGMSPEEARYAALRSFGGAERVKEESRDVRGILLLEELWQDLRYGARMLLKNLGFTLIATLTLALGTGVNTALFTVYDAFVLKPLPLKDPYSIANVTGYDREGKRNPLFSYLDYVDYRDRSTMFAGLIAWNNFTAPFGELATDGADLSTLPANLGVGRLVSGNYFTVLGSEMALGRGFTPEEDR